MAGNQTMFTKQQDSLETWLLSWTEPRNKHSEQYQHQAESEKAFIWLKTQPFRDRGRSYRTPCLAPERKPLILPNSS